MSLDYNLKQYQVELIKILHDVAAALEGHGVEYQIAFGTLLGAVRHNDIIPWDDDIDITIKRSDYDRALSVIRDACPQYYVWDWDHDPKCDCDFARVFTRITNNQSLENYRAYIDVYPQDTAPATKLGQLINRTLFTAIRRLINRKTGAKLQYQVYTPKSILLYWIAMPFSLMSVDRLRRLYVSIRTNIRSCDFVWYDHNVAPAAWFASTKKLKFGQDYYLAPSFAEEVLCCEYGDWKQIPPAGQRGEHAYTQSGRELVTKPEDALRK